MVKLEQGVTGMTRNVKASTEIPAEFPITRGKPGKAHGLEPVRMRARGGARLPPPSKPRDKRKVIAVVTSDMRAGAAFQLKYGK